MTFRRLARATALAAIVATTPATQAQVSDQMLEYCEAVGETARLIMSFRFFEDWSLIRTMKHFRDDYTMMPETIEYLVLEAFDRPAYSTQKMQEEAESEFRDEAQLACMRGNLGFK